MGASAFAFVFAGFSGALAEDLTGLDEHTSRSVRAQWKSHLGKSIAVVDRVPIACANCPT